MKNKGFTLIEVMVVLSILAIIAILGYNFFGSTMKEARTTSTAVEIYRGLQAFSDSVEKYRLDVPDASGQLGYSDNGTLQAMAIMDELKALPTIPASAIDTSCANARGELWHVSVAGWSMPGAMTAENDDYVNLWCVKEDIAEKFNSMYSNTLGSTVYNNSPTDFIEPSVESTYCYDVSGANYCIMYIDVN